MQILNRSRLHLTKTLLRSYGSIFCLHRVGRRSDEPVLAGNKYIWLSDETLDDVISYMKRLGMSFVALEEHLECLERGRRANVVSITFDDGYRDNLTAALPVLEAHGAPATIFVATGLVDQTTPLWWVALETFAAAGEAVPLTFEEMRNLHLSGGVDAVRTAFDRAGLAINWSTYARDHIMSWNEICRAIEHPLITIGAHTISHPSLKALAPDAAREEMAASRERLEVMTGLRPTILAYPFGSPDECGARKFTMARELGFRAAVTTYPGALYARHKDGMHSLPRTCLSEPQVSFRLLENKLSGYDDLRCGRWRGAERL